MQQMLAAAAENDQNLLEQVAACVLAMQGPLLTTKHVLLQARQEGQIVHYRCELYDRLATRTARAGLTSTTTGWHSYKCGLVLVLVEYVVYPVGLLGTDVSRL